MFEHIMDTIESFTTDDLTLDFLLLFQDKMLKTFYHENTDINTTVNDLISLHIIPNIHHSQYYQMIDVLKRCTRPESKDIICSNWRMLFRNQIPSVKTINDTINFLAETNKTEQTFSYVDMDCVRMEMWEQDKMDISKWNKWIHANMVDFYTTSTEEFDNIKVFLKFVHNRKDYDTFIVNYMFNLRNRMKMLIDMDSNNFQRIYNHERTMLDNMNIRNVTDFVMDMKQMLIDTLTSFHLNAHFAHDGRSLLINSSYNNTESELLIPLVFQQYTSITGEYEKLFPHRTFHINKKQSMIRLKDSDVIISGSILPLSILYLISQNNGLCDMNQLEQAMIPAQPTHHDKCVQDIVHCIEILKSNKLLVNNRYVKPKHNLILKENIKTTKLSVTIPKEVQINRDMVLMCYTMKCAKQFKNDNVLSLKRFYQEVCDVLRLFTPTLKEFKTTLAKCIDRELLEFKDDLYMYI
jgi:hypothetical protein